MKYLLIALITLAISLIIYGSIYINDTFIVDFYDSYFVVTYKDLGILCGIVTVGIAFITYLFKKVRNK